ncbi:MAG: branched-chain amino acid transaminase [Anaerolineae bacterium]|nr:MAG: branched-chain amino acid transaminase [Anaerolineae bacterium]
MSDTQAVEYLWLDGEGIPLSEANFPISTISASASTSVFEGIRGYWNQEVEQLYVFRCDEHMRRFDNSMKMVWMDRKFSTDDLVSAGLGLLRTNGARKNFYIRGMAFNSGRGFFAEAQNLATHLLLETLPIESHLGAIKRLDCCVSSWTRIADHIMPPRIKAGPNYANNRRALQEARINGYDDAILLNTQGKVSETTGACVFVIRDGRVMTSPVTSGILESITRATLIRLFDEQLELPVLERDIDRTELYIADEVFCCGTGREIAAVSSVDRFPVGDGEIGPITQQIVSLYRSVVHGEQSEYQKWCTPVW